MTEEFKPQYLIPSKVKRTPPVTKGHVCGVCQKWFKKSGDLRRHYSVHSKEKPISCDHCNLKFANKDRLYQHRKYHSLEKTHYCELCKKSFKTFSCLKLHSRVHSKEKPFKCEMCNKYFRRKNALEYHYASSTYLPHHKQFDEFKQFEYLLEKHKLNENSLHVCTFCNKRFKTATHLELHVIIHIDEKPHECDICGLKSKRKQYILKHKSAVHSGNRELYSCDICRKSFVSKSFIALHKASVHEKYKPFACKICSRTYLHKCLLNKHMTAHSGEKKYACTMCDKRYRNLASLKYHTRDHTGEKPYVCQVCNTCFKGSDMLKNHSKKCKEKETTLDSKENTDSKLGLNQPEKKNMDIKIEVSGPESENTYSKIGSGLPKMTSWQSLSSGPSAAKEASCKRDKVIMSKNIKFVKVQNAAELNFLRVTHLFQTYRYLSNVYSK